MKGQLAFLVRDINLGQRRGGAGIALPRASGQPQNIHTHKGPIGPLRHFKDTRDDTKDPKGYQTRRDRQAALCKANKAGELDHTNKEERADTAANEVLHPAGGR